jgi:hypothetical protein
MDKTYSPGDIEERIYRRWESEGLFAPAGDGAPFCIVIRRRTSPARSTWGTRSRTPSWTR